MGELNGARQLAAAWEKATYDCEVAKVLADAAARKYLELQTARDEALAKLKNELRLTDQNQKQNVWVIALESGAVAVVHINFDSRAEASVIGKPQ